MSETSFFHTSYRRDVSSWGGKGFERAKGQSDRSTLARTAVANRAVDRCLRTIQTNCKPIQTPQSTMRHFYTAHMPVTKEAGPTFSKRVPNIPPPPDEGDQSVLRPSTEYGSHYIPPNPRPFLNPELVERHSTTTHPIRSRALDLGDEAPRVNTTYRDHFCSDFGSPSLSEALTFHGVTHLR